MMKGTFRPNRPGLSAVLNSFQLPPSNPQTPQQPPHYQCSRPPPKQLPPVSGNFQPSDASRTNYITIPDQWPGSLGGGNGRKDASLPMPEPAVRVREVFVTVGHGADTAIVLNGVNLTIPAGTIYGLLGPSGCGKTTLLRCILGCARPTHGVVRIFGHHPGRPGSGIPGPGVGYMPQELALHDDLTVDETLLYFGHLFNLPTHVLRLRVQQLTSLLDIHTERHRLVATLSGGQKRRLSFGAALIHKPRLVILDEPTVGVDPILRERIWSCLISCVERDKMTILVTTHYIEEARRANIVAFMRRGRILAEDTPRVLCKRFAAATLEDVFYKLCLSQKRISNRTAFRHDSQLPANNNRAANHKSDVEGLGYKRRTSHTISFKEQQYSSNTDSSLDSLSYPPSEDLKEPLIKLASSWLIRYKTVTKKVLLQSFRQKPLIFAQFILPFVTLLLFCICVGHTPKGVPLGVLNEERPAYLSQLYLNSINTQVISLVPLDSEQQGIDLVKATKLWGYVRIKANFSDSLVRRFNINDEPELEDNGKELIDQSTIRVHADLTNRILSISMQRTLESGLKKFLEQTAEELDINAQLFQYPIVIGKVIYGRNSSANADDYFAVRDYGIPGLLVILTYSCAFGLTVLVLTGERRDQTFERNYVAGVTTVHLILSHLTSRLMFMIVNVISLFLLSINLFDVQLKGHFLVAVSLLVLQAIAGLTHGMLISALCSSFFMSVVFSNFVLLFMFIVSGVLWPVESLPTWLRWFSYIQPTTLATESLRSVLSRGLGLSSQSVLTGFAVTFAWIILFFIGSLLVFRHSR